MDNLHLVLSLIFPIYPWIYVSTQIFWFIYSINDLFIYKYTNLSINSFVSKYYVLCFLYFQW